RSAQKLRKEGIPVQIVADSAAALAAALIPLGTSAKGQENRVLLDSPVYYFCGNQHLKTLPDAFASAEMALEVQIIYQSQAVSKAFNTAFEVLFFYSPSGVAAFCQENTIGTAFVVAIGPTTAAAVALHTNNCAVAKRPSFAHMLSALRAHDPNRLNKKTP
ncbi:MAG: uroporphyrinogen-III synthase, partial [Flavobacteriia bacterium]|nr:uroporphyrinogen-III synthase [Flavobacteriia bacterium]